MIPSTSMPSSNSQLLEYLNRHIMTGWTQNYSHKLDYGKLYLIDTKYKNKTVEDSFGIE